MSNRFLELRSSGEYIDRTFFIPSLIKNRYVTLSRPRGLGSSVFCDMLEQYFLGLRENFRGLAIERLETEWRKSPVLSIDLKFIPRDSDDLRRYLFRFVSDFAVSQGIQLRSDTPTSALKEITSKLDGLAVIIKHADYPLYMNYGNPDLENIDQALAKFLFPLFNLKERVRFVFLSKCYPVLLCRDMFGEVLDGIVDISRMPRFAAVTGFTPAEAKRKYLSDAETLSANTNLSPESLFGLFYHQYGGYRFTPGKIRVVSPAAAEKAAVALAPVRAFESDPLLDSVLDSLSGDVFGIDDFLQRPLSPEFALGPFYSFRPEIPSVLFASGLLTIDSTHESADLDEPECMLRVTSEDAVRFLRGRGFRLFA